MTDPQSIAERAMAAARAKRQRQQEEEEARKEAERREVERLTEETKAYWVPVFNQELSKVLGEQVELDWEWNVPMKVAHDQRSLEPIHPREHPCFQTKINPAVCIEAHVKGKDDGRSDVMFRVAVGGGSSGPLDSIEDLGDALLTYRPPSESTPPRQ